MNIYGLLLGLLFIVSLINRGTSQGCSRDTHDTEPSKKMERFPGRPWETSTWKDPDFVPPADEQDIEDTGPDAVCLRKDYVTVMIIAAMYPQSGTMVLIRGGNFTMGDEDEDLHYYDGEAPLRTVYLNDFYMDDTEVSYSHFALFIEETGYETTADKRGTSTVFYQQITPKVNRTRKFDVRVAAPWWYHVYGANWAKPYGPGSSWEDIYDHPVTHVSWSDAAAYCEWAGKRLPTEAEWEYSCRGGKEGKLFPWGNKLVHRGRYWSNTWTGRFPYDNTAEDGHKWTAPARSYPPNDFGLYEMTGNVWEWVEDWWTHIHPEGPLYNPTGPQANTRLDKTRKGGSFMCHQSFCYRYRCSGRHESNMDYSASNLGFRCAKTKYP